MINVDVQDGHDCGERAASLALAVRRSSVKSGFDIGSPTVWLWRTGDRNGRKTQESRKNDSLYVCGAVAQPSVTSVARLSRCRPSRAEPLEGLRLRVFETW